MGAEPAALRRPVSGSSVLQHDPRVRYTEVGGLGVLCNVDTRTVNALSPAAAAAWARIDGRTPLSAITGHGELVELARRLRAIGAVVDAPDLPAGDEGGDAAERDDLATASADWADIRVRAVAAPTDHGTVVVELADDQPLAPSDGPYLTITVGPASIAAATVPVELLLAPGGDVAGPPLDVVQALQEIVTRVDPLHLGRPGCLDACAELAERVEVVGIAVAGAAPPIP